MRFTIRTAADGIQCSLIRCRARPLALICSTSGVNPPLLRALPKTYRPGNLASLSVASGPSSLTQSLTRADPRVRGDAWDDAERVQTL